MVAAFPVTPWSLQRVSQMEHKDMLHATYRLKIAICCSNKRYLPLGDRCPHELVMLMKRPDKLKQAKVGFKRFCYLLECDINFFEFNVLPFSFKGLSKFRITTARENGNKPLSFVSVQFVPGVNN
jgi:hypothetical protein